MEPIAHCICQFSIPMMDEVFFLVCIEQIVPKKNQHQCLLMKLFSVCPSPVSCVAVMRIWVNYLVKNLSVILKNWCLFFFCFFIWTMFCLQWLQDDNDHTTLVRKDTLIGAWLYYLQVKYFHSCSKTTKLLLKV